MNPIASIVAPAVDVNRIAREVAAANVALQDAERNTKAVEEKSERQNKKARTDEDMRRLDLGRLLCEARKAWPAKSGPKAKGWTEFLLTVGIEQQRASELMRYAGYVAEHSPEFVDSGECLPSLRDAGIDTKPRKSDRREPEQVALIEDDDAVDVDVEDEEDSEEVTEYGRGVEARITEAPRHSNPKSFDLSRELLAVHHKVMDVARSWPSEARKQLAEKLRVMAEAIEEMV